MNRKGENIVKAIHFIQTFFCEVMQLFKSLDDLMEQERWTNEEKIGNRTSRENSSDLKKPKKWLPTGSFRLYENDDYPNLRKGITVCYNPDEIGEPLLIIGSISYNDKGEAKDWDLRDLWFDDKQKKNLNKYYDKFDLYKERINQEIGTTNWIYAMNLVEISTEEDIKEKIFKKLMGE